MLFRSYHIHSAVGEKIVGAKADGKIIPLSKELKNTQIIEIITNPNAHPTESQLKSVHTSKAKQKIHAWLVANIPNFEEKQNTTDSSDAPRQNKKRIKNGIPSQRQTTGKIKIGNATNFVITIAQCCSPKYPEAIVGYVSRVRGITIHKPSCTTFLRIPDIEHRTIDVEWDTTDEK